MNIQDIQKAVMHPAVRLRADPAVAWTWENGYVHRFNGVSLPQGKRWWACFALLPQEFQAGGCPIFTCHYKERTSALFGNGIDSAMEEYLDALFEVAGEWVETPRDKVWKDDKTYEITVDARKLPGSALLGVMNLFRVFNEATPIPYFYQIIKEKWPHLSTYQKIVAAYYFWPEQESLGHNPCSRGLNKNMSKQVNLSHMKTYLKDYLSFEEKKAFECCPRPIPTTAEHINWNQVALLRPECRKTNTPSWGIGLPPNMTDESLNVFLTGELGAKKE